MSFYGGGPKVSIIRESEVLRVDLMDIVEGKQADVSLRTGDTLYMGPQFCFGGPDRIAFESMNNLLAVYAAAIKSSGSDEREEEQLKR